jgi:hypothetical protein
VEIINTSNCNHGGNVTRNPTTTENSIYLPTKFTTTLAASTKSPKLVPQEVVVEIVSSPKFYSPNLPLLDSNERSLATEVMDLDAKEEHDMELSQHSGEGPVDPIKLTESIPDDSDSLVIQIDDEIGHGQSTKRPALHQVLIPIPIEITHAGYPMRSVRTIILHCFFLIRFLPPSPPLVEQI